MQEYVYRVWCVTEADHVSTDWTIDAPPTVCPNDPGHTITPSKTAQTNQRSTIHFNKAVNPTSSDDTTLGYEDNDAWHNTVSHEVFMLLHASTGHWARSAGHSVLPLIGRMSPTVDGVIDVLGWHTKTDTAASLTSASPVTMAEATYHSHVTIDVSAASGLPFTIRLTGTSIDESTGVTTASDTEDLAVTANGYYQSAKSWVDAVQISIVEASKSCTIDIYKSTYWDRGNTDFTLTGCRLEWIPDAATWSINLKIYHVQDDGSLYTIDDTTFTQASSPARAANDKSGKYKRGDYSRFVQGANSQGIIVSLDQTNIGSLYLDMGYSS